MLEHVIYLGYSLLQGKERNMKRKKGFATLITEFWSSLEWFFSTADTILETAGTVVFPY